MTRPLPITFTGAANLIGALEALEDNCRWLVNEYPDLWQLDSIRHYLRSIDQIEAAGRFDNGVSEKRQTAMRLHPSGKNRDLTSSLESQTTHPPAATTPALQEPSGGSER